MKWYLHCEHDALGLFFGSFFWLQLMFLLRFTGIRQILLLAGGCGLAILALEQFNFEMLKKYVIVQP